MDAKHPVTVLAGALLLLFDAWLVYKLARQIQKFPARLGAAQAARNYAGPGT